MTTENKMLEIAMSERRPLKIDPKLWPVIADAKDHDHEYEFQANRTWTIRVREHADGRRIVYGFHTSQFQGERGAHGGFLIDAVDAKPDEMETVRSIRRVAGIIDHAKLADECIADLPSEELS